mmetsp:Transcript_18044/g.44606  ORF Transcript_18044/g.44606 Transcript_18044/m.44606 type:complete len:214 (-) Transcript_18044:31-672(-)
MTSDRNGMFSTAVLFQEPSSLPEHPILVKLPRYQQNSAFFIGYLVGQFVSSRIRRQYYFSIMMACTTILLTCLLPKSNEIVVPILTKSHVRINLQEVGFAPMQGLGQTPGIAGPQGMLGGQFKTSNIAMVGILLGQSNIIPVIRAIILENGSHKDPIWMLGIGKERIQSRAYFRVAVASNGNKYGWQRSRRIRCVCCTFGRFLKQWQWWWHVG